MSTTRQEGAESPELSLESQRRAMLHSAVRTGQNSLFNYFGFNTLDAEGLQERGIVYPQPQMPIVPNIAQVAPAPQPQVQPHFEQPVQPQRHVERPMVAERPIMPAEQPATVDMQPSVYPPERVAAAPLQPAAPRLAPQPFASIAPAPKAPVHETPHMIDARAQVEAAFAEMQLESQPPVQPAEQPIAMHREGYDLAA